ncbi:MAG: DNA polymerase III subunit delta [bacterium]|nr:DNA polymerase III subunit delta [bacterium]
MIIFLHGPDSFRGRAKLKAIVEKFKEQRDQRGDNVIFLEGEKITLDDINSKIAAQSLLAEKRMIIIENIFAQKEETIFKQLTQYLADIEQKGNENVLIFFEGRELDSKQYGAKKLTVARKKLFDHLSKQPYSEKYVNLNNLQLGVWVKTRLKEKNLTIEPQALQQLIIRTEGNLWQLKNDLHKLVNYLPAQKYSNITLNDVLLLTRGGFDDSIFALTDALGNNNKAFFFSLLEGQIENGIAIQQILPSIIRHFKNMLMIKDQLLQNKTAATIAKDLGLHPFVVKKTSAQTHNFNLSYLKNALRQLIEIDCQIKTGQTPSGLTSLNLLFVR